MPEGAYFFFFWLNIVVSILAFFRNRNERYAPYFFALTLNPLIIYILSVEFQIRNDYIVYVVTSGSSLITLLLNRTGKRKLYTLSATLLAGLIISLLDRDILLDRIFLLLIFFGICGIIMYDAYPVQNKIRFNPFLLVLLLYQFSIIAKHMLLIFGVPFSFDYFYLSSWMELIFLLFMTIFKESSFPNTIHHSVPEMPDGEG